MTKRKYKSIEKVTREKALNDLSSGNSMKMSEALLSLAYYEQDYDWLLNLCLKYLDFKNLEVKSTAILCFSHIARTHGKINKRLIIPKLRALSEEIPELSGRIEDVLEDIDIFIKARKNEKPDDSCE